MLASLAMGNLALRYLKHCRLPEANELAAAVITAMILAVILAVSQCKVPRMILAGIQCGRLQAMEHTVKITLRHARPDQRG